MKIKDCKRIGKDKKTEDREICCHVMKNFVAREEEKPWTIWYLNEKDKWNLIDFSILDKVDACLFFFMHPITYKIFIGSTVMYSENWSVVCFVVV